MKFWKYCLSMICSFSLYFSFRAFYFALIVSLLMTHFWSFSLMQIASQYCTFASAFLKAESCIAFSVSLTAVLMSVMREVDWVVNVVMTMWMSSSISHCSKRENHFSKFSRERIETERRLLKSSSTFMLNANINNDFKVRNVVCDNLLMCWLSVNV